jgi:ParB-like chromosome segregation protein Spo0J
MIAPRPSTDRPHERRAPGPVRLGEPAEVVAMASPRAAEARRRLDAPVEVGVDELRFDLSPRHQDVDEEHVAVLAGALENLPPIVVHAPSMQVIDGVHRVMAARAAGLDTVPALLSHGTEEEAAVQAIYFNVAHGKPLTFAEREAATTKVLALQPAWSDRRIAAVCGLSPKTVARLRVLATVEDPQLRARVGRDGRRRAIDPIEARERIAATIEADPGASNRSIAAETGASQRTVRDVRDRMARGEDILSPRLAARRRREQREQAEAPASEDEAFEALPGGAEFARWLDAHVVTSDDEWRGHVDAVPLSRVYEVADTARRCAGTWERLASALEGRISGRTASKGATP